MSGPEATDSAESRPVQLIDDDLTLAGRFTGVYPAAGIVFDELLKVLVAEESARALCREPRTWRKYKESPARQVVQLEEVGFDPAETDATIKCNLWAGWPTKAKQGNCETLLELLGHLCSGDKQADELYRWVLRWLAYPIQHPGAKMQTALVFHGPQGSGKNLFFEAIMAIYGKYGRIIDQSAIEDKFNDWASRKLFLIADEVVARLELYHTKNKLKSLITGEWIRINPKNMQAYDEKNHANLVFLSNEIQPIVLEGDDRRSTVIWTPPPLDAAFYETVRIEIENGGIAALHHHLLHVDLGDFKPWTKPPMTLAKQELIVLGMESSQRFWLDWLNRSVPLPLSAARADDLYEAYQYWCRREGITRPAPSAQFLGNCSKRPGAYKTRKRTYRAAGDSTARQGAVYWPPGVEHQNEIGPLSDELNAFADAVKEWRKEREAA